MYEYKDVFSNNTKLSGLFAEKFIAENDQEFELNYEIKDKQLKNLYDLICQNLAMNIYYLCPKKPIDIFVIITQSVKAI